MKEQNQLNSLLGVLRFEIAGAKVDSSEGEFPILDLISNLREASVGKPELAQFHSRSTGAWQEMVQIVESGRPFSRENLEWLQALLQEFQALAGGEVPLFAQAPTTSAQSDNVVVALPAPEMEDPPLVLNLATDSDLLREFINESREHLDNIEQGALVLENQPGDPETLNTIFRAFHTFKGGAGFLNLIPVNRLAHILESLLDLARQGKLVIDHAIVDMILRGRDILKQFVDEIDGRVNQGKAAGDIRISTVPLKEQVQRAIDRATTSGPSERAKDSSCSIPGPEQRPEGAASPEAAIPAGGTLGTATGETPAAASQVSDLGAVVKVDTGKLDALLDLVGEMVVAQSLVAQDSSRQANPDSQFARNMAQLGRITKELQRVSMSMRMVPIRGLFQKMTRVVRDLGARQHKKVRLATSGEDTELDRGVVEELNDPLLHMMRNSMDHGIESADKRAAAGKQAVGTINLSASHQGGNIVIEISDDGGGLNRDRILAKAIERGLTTADARLTEEEIFSFIFAPGFSTADKITDISGRGVGLDVVYRNISRLRGSVSISSTLGKGAVFKITLPLTLAIIDALIVKVGEERFIIPTLSVRESFRPRADMITRVQGKAEVVNVRGRLIPLLRLNQFFGIPSAVNDPTQGIVVVAQSGASYQCLLVDCLLHKQEVVIKNLNEIMIHKNRTLAGAAILGDGRVGLILDVNSLVHQDGQALTEAA